VAVEVDGEVADLEVAFAPLRIFPPAVAVATARPFLSGA